VGPGDRSTGLDDVTVAFGDGPPALRGVTLLAEPGEVLAVVGPSGCGKTTALRAVAGLETVRTGRVVVAGRDVTRVPTPRRDIVMVFQPGTLSPFLDVAVSLARAVEVRAAPRRRRSPGPAAFLLDEPLARLDAVERARTRRTIVDLVRQSGVSALYVTHDLIEAMAVGDRLAVLRDGEVVQIDTPRRLYECPIDTFVARFVGAPEIGLLPARLVSSPSGAGFRVGERTLPLWGPAPDGLDAGVRVVLGLRAEDVGESGPGADPGSVTVRVLVRHVELRGRDAVVTAEVDVAGEADGGRLVARVDPRTRLRPGDRAELAVDARRAHVFDVDGRALRHPPA